MVFGVGLDAELLEDVADVLLDGVLGDHEACGDALVGAAFGHQLEDFSLAGGEFVERVIGAVADE